MQNIMKNFQNHWQSDVAAGFVVFLVALPLCLGIALASGAPIVSGLISAIIAGCLVSWLSGSELSVSGPAAGLTSVVAAGILHIGSWTGFLTATVIAGVIQIVFGVLRCGALASFFPNCVIKGMMAAIGLIIIIKQIPHAVGWDSDFEGDESFFQQFDHSNTFQSLVDAWNHITPGALIVSVIAVLIVWLWSRPAIQSRSYFKVVPAPLLVVVAGVITNKILGIYFGELALVPASGHLVAVPQFSSLNGFMASLSRPDFSVVGRADVWVLGLTMAAIASIESLLSVEAADRMDPDRRITNGNKELIAQGVGNVFNGLFGGLVMTAVIVRSSTNIYAGAKSRVSCFVHGLLMLLSVLVLAPLLNEIPLASLAIVLISVGLKLTHPFLVRGMWNLGGEQFLPFVVTIIAILFSDLLTGVAVGLGVALLIIVRMNHQRAITVVSDQNLWLIRFAKDVSFAHKGAFKKALAEIPDGSSVIIDGAGASFIDFDILEEIKDFLEVAPRRNIIATWKNLRSFRMTMRWKHNGKLQEPAFSE